MQASALPLGALTLAAVRRHIDTQFWSDQACAEVTLATAATTAMTEIREYFHMGSPPCGSVVSLALLIAQLAGILA